MSSARSHEAFKDELSQIVRDYDSLIAGLAGLTRNLHKRLYIDVDVLSSQPEVFEQLPREDNPSAGVRCHTTNAVATWSPSEVNMTTPKSVASTARQESFMAKFSTLINDDVAFPVTADSAEWKTVASSCCSWFRSEKRDLGTEQAMGHAISHQLFGRGSGQNRSSKDLDVVAGCLILANCLVVMVQLEYQGHRSAVSVGLNSDLHLSWDHADEWFAVLEHVFNGSFIVELLLRFYFNVQAAKKEKTVMLDIFLVLASSIQLYLLEPLGVQKNGAMAKLSVFRMLRFVRFVRVFRLVRVLKMFAPLRVLVKTVKSSFYALVWSMMLLLIIMVMGGMFLCELLTEWIREESNPLSTRQWAFKHYGSSFRAIYTLFEVTLAGCWPSYFRPLIEQVSGYYVIFALVYITIVVFAIIRIITALFLKETLVIASDDADMMVGERMRGRQAYLSKLKKLFDALDSSGDGAVSAEEFDIVVNNAKVRAWLQCLDVEVHDATQLFKLIDDGGDGQITVDEFLRGLMRLKGQARTMDVVSIMASTEKILNEVTKIASRFPVSDLPISDPVASCWIDSMSARMEVIQEENVHDGSKRLCEPTVMLL